MPESTPFRSDDIKQPAWLARILSASDSTAGTGVLIDPQHVITCAHVIDPTVDAPADTDRRLQIELPFANRWSTATVLATAWRPVRPDGSGDLAVLRLENPVRGLAPAPLQRTACDAGTEVKLRGFPYDQSVSPTSPGRLSNTARLGWIQIDPVGARGWTAELGFSGGPVWDPRRRAVIGLTVAKDAHDTAYMLPLSYLCDLWPPLAERLQHPAPTSESDLSHWWPRSRGVANASESGWLFRGRTRALTECNDWLEAGRRFTVLAVTGSPGTGKSAILGRLVATAHRAWAEQLPQDDFAVRARLGSVDCAVHAKDQNALEVARAILTRAEEASSECELDTLADFPGRLAKALVEADQFNIVVDALDEAAEAREIVKSVLRPVTELPVTKLIVGSRKHDADGNLLAHFGSGLRTIDLDDPGYFELEDLAAYAEATLRQASSEQATQRDDAGPYRDAQGAARVAAKIAALSEGNFLIAGLVARSHGRYDDAPVDPDELAFTADRSIVFRELLERVEPLDGVKARDLLTALAFAEAPGFTVELWATAIKALEGRTVAPKRLTRWARGEAANFLTESGTGDNRSFRLFHQALADACQAHRATDIEATSATEASLTECFLDLGGANGWEQAPRYLWRSLPGHADRADRIDLLLDDLEYLVVADPVRLHPILDRAKGDKAKRHATIFRASASHLQNVSFRDRRSMLAYNAARCKDQRAIEVSLGAAGPEAPGWKPLWATGSGIDSRLQLSIPTLGRIDQLRCTTIAGTPVAVTIIAEDFLDAWDLRTGAPVAEMRTTAQGPATALDCTQIGGRTMGVVGHENGTVSIVDLHEARVARTIAPPSHHAVKALACIDAGHRVTILVCNTQGDVWTTDLGKGNPQRLDPGPSADIGDLAGIAVDGAAMMVTVGRDESWSLWEVDVDQSRAILAYQGEPIASAAGISTATIDHQPVLATSNANGQIAIWDLSRRQRVKLLQGPHDDPLRGISTLVVDGHLHVAAAHQRGGARVWGLDPQDGFREIRVQEFPTAGDFGPVSCVALKSELFLAALKPAGLIQVLKPNHGWEANSRPELSADHRAVAFVRGARESWIATGSASGEIVLRDAGSGRPRHRISGQGAIYNLSAVTRRGKPLLAATTLAGRLRIFDGETLRELRTIEPQRYWSAQVSCTIIEGRTTAVVQRGGEIQVLDLKSGKSRRAISAWMTEHLDTLVIDGDPCAAAVSKYGEIELWNLRTGKAHSKSLDLNLNHCKAFACTVLEGRAIAAIGDFNRVSIVDLHSRDEIDSIPFPEAITSLDFADDGRLAVLSGNDVSLFKGP